MGIAAGDEVIAGVAAADFDHVGLGTKVGDVGRQDNFGVGHDLNRLKRKTTMERGHGGCQSSIVINPAGLGKIPR